VTFYSKKQGRDNIDCKKREEWIRSRAHEMGRFPRPVNGETVAQSMAESRGSDSNVELNDTWINQTSSPMEN
jgi:hypothetical protein